MPTGVYKRTKPAYWIGKKMTAEHKEKIRQSHKGEKNYQWQGGEVNYRNLHRWVAKWKGKPSKCEMCGTQTAKKFEWANVDQNYRRVLEDYIRMCTKCHHNYDKLHINRKRNKKGQYE